MPAPDRIVSTVDHVQEPPDLWTSRLQGIKLVSPRVL